MRPVVKPEAAATPPPVVEKVAKPPARTTAPTEVVDSPPPPPEQNQSESLLSEAAAAAMRQHPIPPPSEPMQYRAIGLIRGRYTPSEEQFTRGELITSDNVSIEAVLLGRVMSLVKNHIDLTTDHLWVVYPRTREKQEDLHAQIVGIWEPENLSKTETETEEAEGAEESEAQDAQSETSEDAEAVDATAKLEGVKAQPKSIPSETAAPAASFADVEDNYFSIRGEVVFHAPEASEVVIKIQQNPRKTGDKGKVFKLKLLGTLEGKVVGYFWDFHVQRQAGELVITQSKSIGMVPPKKNQGGKNKFGKPPGRTFKKGPDRPFSKGGRPTEGAAAAVPARREPLPKPVKRQEPSGNGG
ncbi:MAG: hypothetical protein KME16_25040 [Scytolyngbya sp. HA4215-MV1]|nr:hypothetical protein [Scytolyngbya sp. HA4215-MV1]